MSIQPTLLQLPETGTLLRECGLPLACVVQPFAPLSTQHQQPLTPSTAIARCKKCGGYINPYCSWDTAGWACALCSTINDFHMIRHQRYTRPSAHQHCPELASPTVELLVQHAVEQDEDDEYGLYTDATHHPPAPEGALAYIILLDISIGGDALELIKAAVQAAIEAMPSSSLVGIITFSSTVGLVDTRGSAPIIRNVPVPTDTNAPVLEFADVLPLDCLLVPVGSCREMVDAAVEALVADKDAPDAAVEAAIVEDGAVLAQASELTPPRAYGAALQGALRYVAGLAAGADLRPLTRPTSSPRPTPNVTPTDNDPPALRCAGVRMLSFLQGTPNFGPGALLVNKYFHPRLEMELVDTNPYMILMPNTMDQDPASRWRVVLNEQAVKLYTQLAAAAAALGVCLDVYGVGRGFMALEYIKPLASRTGGCCALYPVVEEAALPQDVYKRLTTPFAFDGLLRLRCPPELKVATAHGHLWPDTQHENLLHCGGCSPHDCFVFDLEYTKPAVGLSRRTVVQGTPVLQLVFQCSVLVPQEGEGGGGEGQGEEGEGLTSAQLAGRFILQRRLRVCTIPLGVATEGPTVLQGAHPEVIMTCLLHRVLRVAAKEGTGEARLLLRDWLVNLTARYNWLCRASARLPQPVADVTFESAPTLQLLPRLIYALIRSPLLDPTSTSTTPPHPDMHAALHHLWTTLPPSELACAIYPRLCSYTDPDTEALPRHSLSKAALLTSQAPLFLLDTYSHVILYCRDTCPPDLAFPPALDSKVRVLMNTRVRQRQQTPVVKLIREGIDDTSAFEDWLVEDAHHPTHTHTNTTQHHQQQEDDIHGGAFSLLLFLGKIRSEAESYIRDFPGHRAAAAVVAAQSPRHQPRAHGGVYGTPPSRGHRNGGEGGVYSPAHVLQG